MQPGMTGCRGASPSRHRLILHATGRTCVGRWVLRCCRSVLSIACGSAQARPRTKLCRQQHGHAFTCPSSAALHLCSRAARGMALWGLVGQARCRENSGGPGKDTAAAHAISSEHPPSSQTRTSQRGLQLLRALGKADHSVTEGACQARVFSEPC